MENKKVSLIVILISIILICLVIIGFQYLRMKQLEENMISLTTGTPLPELELTYINNSHLQKSKKIKLIFIFKSPCSSCNPNLQAWKNLARYFGDNIEVLGIILDGRLEAERLMDEQLDDFQLYIPINIASFRKKMHLRLNIAQTIIASENKIISTRIGTLAYTDIEAIIKSIKETLNGS